MDTNTKPLFYITRPSTYGATSFAAYGDATKLRDALQAERSAGSRHWHAWQVVYSNGRYFVRTVSKHDATREAFAVNLTPNA